MQTSILYLCIYIIIFVSQYILFVTPYHTKKPQKLCPQLIQSRLFSKHYKYTLKA